MTTTMYHCTQGDEVFSSSHSRDEERLLLLDFLQLFQHSFYAEITLEDALGDQVIYTKLTANQYVGCRVGIEDNQLCSPVFIGLDVDDSRDTQTDGAAGAAEKLTQRLIKQLYNHKEVAVRIAVAKNPSTPAATLEQLATDAGSVRLEVAANPNTPAATLVQLATDAHSYIRWAVAKNPHTPAAALKQLATDADSYVRTAVAKHTSSNTGTYGYRCTQRCSLGCRSFASLRSLLRILVHW